jgi:hypothetical protein
LSLVVFSYQDGHGIRSGLYQHSSPVQLEDLFGIRTTGQTTAWNVGNHIQIK